MKILLTGANGFFGRHLYGMLAYGEKNKQHLPWEELIELGRNSDIKDEKFVKKNLEEIKPDVIIHLAANPRGNADISVMDDNVKGTHNLVHYAPEGCQFIFASSIVIYGDYHHFNFLEDMVPKPTSLYALSKLNAENIINRYARIGKIRKVNFRYSALVGSNLSHGFIYDLQKKLVADSQELELIGEAPGAEKPFLHIDDACRSVIFAIENNLEGTYNVCPNDNISVEKVAKIGMNHLKIDKKIKWRPDLVWSGDNRELKAGNCKIFSKGFEFKHKTSQAAVEAYFNESTE
jgi:nucleoside-diphosphate-sugar epimerase